MHQFAWLYGMTFVRGAGVSCHMAHTPMVVITHLHRHVFPYQRSRVQIVQIGAFWKQMTPWLILLKQIVVCPEGNSSCRTFQLYQFEANRSNWVFGTSCLNSSWFVTGPSCLDSSWIVIGPSCLNSSWVCKLVQLPEFQLACNWSSCLFSSWFCNCMKLTEDHILNIQIT